VSNPVVLSILLFIHSDTPFRDIARIMEKYRHKLFLRGSGTVQGAPWGEASRKLMGYTTRKVIQRFFVILEVLLTT
jgi:CBS domain-containing protein